ncbi:alpha/beta hydrolase [Rossellomorea sp. DA94]|jgi:proline iminopeptidase|uniref:alpha/beta fold hydrolase n=1 Tax=Rossellomorea sp. DA94 TaxID=3038653 RepID=UPI00244A0BC6|nr:alpha/beta hydrolase [Rossellomorea sp. DA94]WGG43574.1 alpha/beta hydrolase [Rossellomorea sp. DA94]
MKANMMRVRGKGLHVETYGSIENPALLYLHGGPGESCYDFSFHQGERLGKDLFVVAIDQRGVCRSEAIEEGEPFGFQDLVEDCESLRRELGIDRWSVLGHSFGGFLALAYGSKYQDSIDSLIFECPTFDFTLTSKGLLKKTAGLFGKYNQPELQDKAMSLVDKELSPKGFTEIYMSLSDELKEHRMEIYTHNFDNPTDYYSTYTDEEWDTFYDRSDYHYQLLREEGIIFSNLLEKIKAIKLPMLLLTGEYDPVTCDEHIQTFQLDAVNGKRVHFKHSGHTPHYEEANRFTEVVKRFINTNNLIKQR